MAVGEILIVSNYIAKEYWQDQENTQKVFQHNTDEGSLYWTGDLGRYTQEWGIKIIGRKDNQVKIRGYRVETGEIETVILRHNAIREAAVITRSEEEGQEHYLCAYIVVHHEIPVNQIRDYLYAELPDYMVPRYITILQEMPQTGSGKVDRNQLPAPDTGDSGENLKQAPTNQTQEQLVQIWQEILGVSEIGVQDNFMELGGHSLLIISLLSQILQVFKVELQLQDVFNNPSIYQLAQLISESQKKEFYTIHPVEDTEYYPVTPSQLQMYSLSQRQGIGITYNIPGISILDTPLDIDKLQIACNRIVERHESFRTSFHPQKGKLMQKIHSEVDIPVQVIDTTQYQNLDKEDIGKIIADFIQPFDLGQAPLLKVSIADLPGNRQLVLMDQHHIISDGVASLVVLEELKTLYFGEDLPELKLRYRDYVQWLHNHLESGRIKPQEDYWMNRFSGSLPKLELPLNYPRPQVQSFEGELITLQISPELTSRIREFANKNKTTIFILMLTIYNILLHKYNKQEDIIVGTMNAGRAHPDLEGVVGLFVRTLALRNFPRPQITFKEFLEQVMKNTLQDFENLDYPFSQVLEKLDYPRDLGRNPLFDTVLIVQNTQFKLEDGKPAELIAKSSHGYKNTTAKFDLVVELIETPEQIVGCFQYCTQLFSRNTIELMMERFMALIANVLDNEEALISQLDYRIAAEKEMKQVVDEFEFDF
jgi:acyl carrier protein